MFVFHLIFFPLHKYFQSGAFCDDYRFGIVMWEVWTRELPFEHITTSWDIAEAVQNGERPPALCGADPRYSQLMTACWDCVPDKRPTFEACIYMLDKVVADALAEAPWHVMH
jgi:hypothetical protein